MIYLIIDTETTGLPRHDRAVCAARAIQFGFAVSDGTKLLATDAFLVKPKSWALDYEKAEQVHGISRARVEAEGLDAAAGWARLDNALRYAAQCAQEKGEPLGILMWNAHFDTEFIWRLGLDAGVLRPGGLVAMPDVQIPLMMPGTKGQPPQRAPVICKKGCLMLGYCAWGAHLNVGVRAKLERVQGVLGLAKREGFHGAGSDAVMTAEILHAMLARTEPLCLPKR